MASAAPRVVEAKPAAWQADIRGIRHIRRMERHQAQPPMAPHTHGPSEFEILYLARGRQTQVINHRRYTMTGGDLLLARPGDLHETGPDPEERGIAYWVSIVWPPSARDFVGLAGVLAKSLAAALAGLLDDRRIVLIKGHPGMRRDLDDCLPKAAITPQMAVRIQNRIVHFLLAVVDCAMLEGNPRADGWVRRVVAFIDQQLGERLDDGLLARHFGLSKPWFVSRFRREVGMPPMQFIQHRRVERAQRRLVEAPDVTITEIAFDCGFATTEHFATVFKRYAGMSPRDFRAASRPPGRTGRPPSPAAAGK
jgi:AraC-like DNA-binding protein